MVFPWPKLTGDIVNSVYFSLPRIDFKQRDLVAFYISFLGIYMLNNYHLTAFKKGFDKFGPKKKNDITTFSLFYYYFYYYKYLFFLHASTKYAKLDPTISQGKN